MSGKTTNCSRQRPLDAIVRIRAVTVVRVLTIFLVQATGGRFESFQRPVETPLTLHFSVALGRVGGGGHEAGSTARSADNGTHDRFDHLGVSVAVKGLIRETLTPERAPLVPIATLTPLDKASYSVPLGRQSVS